MAYDFFQNRECEYFPCHVGADPKTFNCLFCFCPLYALAQECGGSFSYTEQGIKDCSRCLKPHCPQGYVQIMEKIPELQKLARKTK